MKEQIGYAGRLKRLVDWFVRDRRTGEVVIAQWPNAWLWIFAAAEGLAWVTGARGPTATALHGIGRLFLAIWAGDEVIRGVNPWRRFLGAAVLIASAITVLR